MSPPGPKISCSEYGIIGHYILKTKGRKSRLVQDRPAHFKQEETLDQWNHPCAPGTPRAMKTGWPTDEMCQLMIHPLKPFIRWQEFWEDLLMAVTRREKRSKTHHA